MVGALRSECCHVRSNRNEEMTELRDMLPSIPHRFVQTEVTVRSSGATTASPQFVLHLEASGRGGLASRNSSVGVVPPCPVYSGHWHVQTMSSSRHDTTQSGSPLFPASAARAARSGSCTDCNDGSPVQRVDQRRMLRFACDNRSFDALVLSHRGASWVSGTGPTLTRPGQASKILFTGRTHFSRDDAQTIF
jgi:hypothetical protein